MGAAGRRRISATGWLQLSFLLAVMLAAGWGLWHAAAGGGAGTPSTPLPREVASYRLESVLAGPGALRELERLHGTRIDVQEAWIGHYEEGAEIWLAHAASEEQARELVAEMTERIQEGNRFFSDLTRHRMDGLEMYAVRGGGVYHHYYSDGRTVVWITPPAGDESAFVRDAIRKVS